METLIDHENIYQDNECIQIPVENTTLKHYINDDENVHDSFGILNTIDSNEEEFIECILHSLENHHLQVILFAQKESGMDYNAFPRHIHSLEQVFTQLS